MRRRVLLPLMMAAVVGAPAGAGAEAGTGGGDVLLFLSAGAPAPVRGRDLADALRIQLAAIGFAVEERDAPPAGTVADQLRAVTALLAASGARLALWHAVESGAAGGAPEVVLYVASPRGEATLVKVVRLPVAPDPALYRTLALKVRALVRGAIAFEDVVARGTAGDGRDAGAAGPAAAPTPPPGPGAAAPAAPARAALSIGLAAGALDGVARWRAGLALRGSFFAGPSLDVFARATFFTVLHAEAPRGAATLRETALGAGVRLRIARPAWEAGVALVLGARLLFVEALTASVAATARALRVPVTAGVEADARLRLTGRIALGAVASLDVSAPREEFTVSGDQVFDAGWVVLGGALFLAVSLP